MHDNITLHETLPSLALLMLKADLAIGAGGTTSWERCCLGLPSLVITLAENQKLIAEELDRQGYIRWLGHYDEVSDMNFQNGLHDLLDDEEAVRASKHCMELVDGKGASRVAAILSLNSNSALKARLAKVDDEALRTDNYAVYTSATGQQISAWYPDKKHSLFTYYFLKAIQGDGDSNNDKKLTRGEIQTYLTDNVEYRARTFNREQSPQMLTTDKNQVVVRY